MTRALFAQKLQNLDAVLLQSILCRLAQLADPRKLLKLSTNYESDRVELSRLGNPCRREHERSKIVHYGVEPQSWVCLFESGYEVRKHEVTSQNLSDEDQQFFGLLSNFLPLNFLHYSKQSETNWPNILQQAFWESAKEKLEAV